MVLLFIKVIINNHDPITCWFSACHQCIVTNDEAIVYLLRFGYQSLIATDCQQHCNGLWFVEIVSKSYNSLNWPIPRIGCTTWFSTDLTWLNIQLIRLLTRPECFAQHSLFFTLSFSLSLLLPFQFSPLFPSHSLFYHAWQVKTCKIKLLKIWKIGKPPRYD